MGDDLHSYSDEALLSEVARRLGLRASASRSADDGAAAGVTVQVGVPAIEIPEGLGGLQHDSEAIRRLLDANRRRGLRRCEIGEALQRVGRQALNIDQKVQYLIGRNELVGEIGPDGRKYWRLATR